MSLEVERLGKGDGGVRAYVRTSVRGGCMVKKVVE